MSRLPASAERIEPAATVILAREHQGELQIYLLRRSPQLRFMPGMHVFPGGRVDPTDRDPDVWSPFLDEHPDALNARLGGDLEAEKALGYAVATIRETYEEAGVLLATDRTSLQLDTSQLQQLRTAGGLQAGWLSDHVRHNGWSLCSSSLSRWSRWVTPAGMKRRYDTLFLLAKAPADQLCQPDGTESDRGLWSSPASALEGNLCGESPLSPPTIVTLHELLEYPHLAALERALPTRALREIVAPRLLQLERGSVIVEPWDPEFGQDEIRITRTHLEKKVLPAGEPFSRIWFNGASWRPISV